MAVSSSTSASATSPTTASPTPTPTPTPASVPALPPALAPALAPAPATTSTATHHSPSHTPPPDPATDPDDVVDGVTGSNAGGREEGDVELALFRRIRSISNMPARFSASLNASNRSPSAAYRHYFHHPLSMFSNEPPQQDPDPSPTPAPAVDRAASQPASTSTSASKPTPVSVHTPTTVSASASASATRAIADRGTAVNRAITDDPDKCSDADQPHFPIPPGSDWRDALIQACATMLGKTVAELHTDFLNAMAISPAANTPFSSETAAFEPAPRDLADFAIVATLKSQDPLAMQNASSWLFNLMDRTGAGYVLRDEFVRYAQFIGPVADAAVAAMVFDELVREQARSEADDVRKQTNGTGDRVAQVRDTPSQKNSLANATSRTPLLPPALRNRRRAAHPLVPEWKEDTLSSPSSSSSSANPRVKNDDPRSSASSQAETLRDPALVLPSAALRFDLWRRFYVAVQDKYECKDEDWMRVKREIGLDQGEVLIKSQGALDHSDLFPTLGKLFLSQRYLVFFAAVGRNHYVARLGAVAQVSNGSIPIMMRDCVRIHLETETKAAIDGVSAAVKESSKSSSELTKERKDGESNEELLLSEHVGKLMKQFTAGRKPLVFSLLEFREKKRRDNWVNLITEMVAAHKLHVQLGFGSSGRAVPSLTSSNSNDGDPSVSNNSDETELLNATKNKVQTLNYAKSPYRNDPSSPLLVVAAHANIVRYRALRRVTAKRVSNSLLIFSHAERNPVLVSWYTDSVRAYDNQSGRTWIERALTAVRDNMDKNDTIYRVQDNEPFDMRKLGDAIGRFAELCSPMVRVAQIVIYLQQWRNPPATILAILVCITIAMNGLVNYVPAAAFFFQALWVVETKYNFFGLGMGSAESEDAQQRQANVLALVAQVHDTLAAAQNVLFRLNRELGKVQALFLWGCPDEQSSWVAVGFLCAVGFILLVVPSKTLFLFLVFFSFFRHFLPPNNPGLQFWRSLPSRIEPPVRKSEGGQRHRRKVGQVLPSPRSLRSR